MRNLRDIFKNYCMSRDVTYYITICSDKMHKNVCKTLVTKTDFNMLLVSTYTSGKTKLCMCKMLKYRLVLLMKARNFTQVS